MTPFAERLPYRPPLDWDGLLAFFAPRAIPGIESIGNGRLRRCYRQHQDWGVLEVRAAEEPSFLHLRRWGAPVPAALARRVLDLDQDPQPVAALFQSDEILAPLYARWPGVRLPGAWDSFEMGVRAILGQQVSVKAAHTLAARLLVRWGTPIQTPFPELTHLFPLPAELAAVPAAELASIGRPRRRAETLHHFAVWSALATENRPPLLSLPGIGPWTESYLRMRAQSDTDAFPAGDLGIQKALGIRDRSPLAAAREAEAISQRWRPYRAYAVFLLWRSLA